MWCYTQLSQKPGEDQETSSPGLNDLCLKCKDFLFQTMIFLFQITSNSCKNYYFNHDKSSIAWHPETVKKVQ